MASADVDSPPKLLSRGLTFYQNIKGSFFSANSERNSADSSASMAKDDKAASLPSVETNSSEEIRPSKSKGHSGKKKEIVSSSTLVPRLEVCLGKKCKAKGSEDLLTDFQTASDGKVEIAYTKCMKECKKGMNARVTKDGTTFEWHHEVSSANVKPILCQHFDW